MYEKGAGSPLVATSIDDLFRYTIVDFHNVIFEHCVRDINYVAHELASIARVHLPRMWTENPLMLLLG